MKKIHENLRKFKKILFFLIHENSRKFMKIHENRENIFANIGPDWDSVESSFNEIKSLQIFTKCFIKKKLLDANGV